MNLKTVGVKLWMNEWFTHRTVGVFFFPNPWIKIRFDFWFSCFYIRFHGDHARTRAHLLTLLPVLVWYQNEQFKVLQWSVSSLTLQQWFRLAVHFDSCYREADAGEDSPARLLLLLSDSQSCLCWDTWWLKWWQWKILRSLPGMYLWVRTGCDLRALCEPQERGVSGGWKKKLVVRAEAPCGHITCLPVLVDHTVERDSGDVSSAGGTHFFAFVFFTL